MSAPTPPPAQEAVTSAATTALPTENPIDPGLFVPQATRDNYLTIIRDQANVRDQDPDAVRDELVEQFRRLHERQPLDGYDHLAGWLEGADLSALAGPTGMQVLTARTLESARRDPYQAVVGDQALVEQGVLAQQRQDADVAAAAVTPAVDPSLGFLPNPGPLPAPTDTTGVVDPAVAEQQSAAAEQTDESGQLTDDAAGSGPSGGAEVTPPAEEPAAEPATEPAPAAEPAPAPHAEQPADPTPAPEPTPPATNGKNGKNGSSSS
jgi:hypothetical protein